MGTGADPALTRVTRAAGAGQRAARVPQRCVGRAPDTSGDDVFRGELDHMVDRELMVIIHNGKCGS